MPADREPGKVMYHHVLRSVEIDCTWCGAGVPLPAGDLCGVCISCGTVMFRPGEKGRSARTLFRSDVRGSGGSFMPAPAV